MWHSMQAGLHTQRVSEKTSRNKALQNIARLWKRRQLYLRSFLQYARGYRFICWHSNLNRHCCVGPTVIETHRLPLSGSEGLSLSVGYCLVRWDLSTGFCASTASVCLQVGRRGGDQWHFGSRDIPGGWCGGGGGGGGGGHLSDLHRHLLSE